MMATNLSDTGRAVDNHGRPRGQPARRGGPPARCGGNRPAERGDGGDSPR